jgi:hypothetical protein
MQSESRPEPEQTNRHGLRLPKCLGYWKLKPMKCPHCNKEISQTEIAAHLGQINGRIGGRVKNEKRAAASRLNGRLGGRPPNKPKEKETADNEND